MSMRGRIAAAALGAAAATITYRWLRRTPPGGADPWTRTNHRGEEVTLLEGPALAAAASAAIAAAPGIPPRLRAAGVLAAAGAGAFGAYDDLTGSGASRGFKGHLTALARGEVTSGAVKLIGIGATGLVAGALVQRRPVDKLLAGVVIAGCANIVNLLDLRPGRAIKAGSAIGAPSMVGSGAEGNLVAAALGAGAALLPDDLRERSMLGDAGANALGAALGAAIASRANRRGLLARAALLAALTATSEKVSFTKVIAATPPLNALDMLGRRPAPPHGLAGSSEHVPVAGARRPGTAGRRDRSMSS